MASPRKILGGSQENVQDSLDEQLVPPKPPRSAFMCFTDYQRQEILDRGDITEDTDILKLVADEWRALSDKDRAYWDEEARNDKVRFVREKAEYKGPWNLPKRRAKKHPLAPKRPMSAFLKYSQRRRAMVKEKNPDMSNTDVSRLLGEMWRSASARERAPYVEEEECERAQYKEDIKKWRDDQAKMDAASRTSHHSVQQRSDKPASSQGTVNHESKEGTPYEPESLHLEEPLEFSDRRRVFRAMNGPAVGNRSNVHPALPSAAYYPYGSVATTESHMQGKSERRFPAPYASMTASETFSDGGGGRYARSYGSVPALPPLPQAFRPPSYHHRHYSTTSSAATDSTAPPRYHSQQHGTMVESSGSTNGTDAVGPYGGHHHVASSSLPASRSDPSRSERGAVVPSRPSAHSHPPYYPESYPYPPM